MLVSEQMLKDCHVSYVESTAHKLLAPHVDTAALSYCSSQLYNPQHTYTANLPNTDTTHIMYKSSLSAALSSHKLASVSATVRKPRPADNTTTRTSPIRKRARTISSDVSQRISSFPFMLVKNTSPTLASTTISLTFPSTTASTTITDSTVHSLRSNDNNNLSAISTTTTVHSSQLINSSLSYQNLLSHPDCIILDSNDPYIGLPSPAGSLVGNQPEMRNDRNKKGLRLSPITLSTMMNLSPSSSHNTINLQSNDSSISHNPTMNLNSTTGSSSLFYDDYHRHTTTFSDNLHFYQSLQESKPIIHQQSINHFQLPQHISTPLLSTNDRLNVSFSSSPSNTIQTFLSSTSLDQSYPQLINSLYHQHTLSMINKSTGTNNHLSTPEIIRLYPSTSNNREHEYSYLETIRPVDSIHTETIPQNMISYSDLGLSLTHNSNNINYVTSSSTSLDPKSSSASLNISHHTPYSHSSSSMFLSPMMSHNALLSMSDRTFLNHSLDQVSHDILGQPILYSTVLSPTPSATFNTIYSTSIPAGSSSSIDNTPVTNTTPTLTQQVQGKQYVENTDSSSIVDTNDGDLHFMSLPSVTLSPGNSNEICNNVDPALMTDTSNTHHFNTYTTHNVSINSEISSSSSNPLQEPLVNESSSTTDTAVDTEDDTVREQNLRFLGDMYTPRLVRFTGHAKEGYCNLCPNGRWLQLKNSAYWYHKQFFHGISSVSGVPFHDPLEKHLIINPQGNEVIEGFCHQCRQWITMSTSKRRNSVLWYRHAHKCHEYQRLRVIG